MTKNRHVLELFLGLPILLRVCSPPVAFGWMLRPSSVQTRRRQQRPSVSAVCAAASTTIDFQADYGRGIDHLTADLEPGNVVVYQTGTWWVDGVAVGDGSTPPAWEYCLVDTIQIVWSHNCEHGVVRGFGMTIVNNEKGGSLLKVDDFDDMIDFGPEQLVARIPVEPVDDDNDDEVTTFRPLSKLSDDLWQPHHDEIS